MQNNNVPVPQWPTNAALERLEVLVGQWKLEITSMSFDPDPSAVVSGRASFAWLEGGAFLIQHSEVPGTDFPQATAVIGPDDKAESYDMLYFDSRGVSRIYQMSLDEANWKMWRDYPGFSQRFTGNFNEDRSMITARWEKSTDGFSWEHDFSVTYMRVNQIGR